MHGLQLHVLTHLVEAVAPAEADEQEDDDSNHDDHKRHHNLHLEVIPPHLTAQSTATLLETISLRATQRVL